MERLAEYLTRQLINSRIIEEEQEEEYIYGFERLLGKILNYTTLIIIAIYYDVLIPTVIFMVVFFSLRERTGGYHMKTPLRCYLGTVGSFLLIIGVAVPVIVGEVLVYHVIMITSMIVIFLFAPVNHPNLLLDEQEMERCQRSSRWLIILIAGCIGIGYVLQIKEIWITYAVMGAGLDAVLILVAKIMGQEVKKDEV